MLLGNNYDQRVRMMLTMRNAGSIGMCIMHFHGCKNRVSYGESVSLMMLSSADSRGQFSPIWARPTGIMKIPTNVLMNRLCMQRFMESVFAAGLAIEAPPLNNRG